MYVFTLIIILFSTLVYSQNNFVGKKEITSYENGVRKTKTILVPLVNTEVHQSGQSYHSFNLLNFTGNNTRINWSYYDPTAIAQFCETNGDGKYNVVGWFLNNQRISLYSNENANPSWEYRTDTTVIIEYNYVSVSETGSRIGAGAYRNVYLFNNSNNNPILNFRTNTGQAAALDVTNDGTFVVCSSSGQDSSTIFGFNSSSGSPVWSRTIVPLDQNYAYIQGVKLCGNGTSVLVNTYSEFFVFRTYTGSLIFHGLIAGGTQTSQGISGDGSIIAIMNGNLLKVYIWDGINYNLIFEYYEPPGGIHTWHTAVDVSYDGNYIAAGTMTLVDSIHTAGKVKVIRNGNINPLWTFEDCGNYVTSVSFSKSGNILSASSWGEINNLTDDLYIFKTFMGSVPIYRLNSSGSLLWCSTSSDGRTVLTSGKAVHAQVLGNGGRVFNITVDTTDVPIGIHSQNSAIVSSYRLYQNYPNPFNPVTKIKFDIPSNVKGQTTDVKLTVFDVIGKEVAAIVNEKLSAGSYEVEFDARDGLGSKLSSGIYFYKLYTGNYSETKRMILLK